MKPNPAWAWGPCLQTIPLLIFLLTLFSTLHEGMKGTLHLEKRYAKNNVCC